MSTETSTPATTPLPVRKEVPSWRLIATLTFAGAIAAACLSFVYETTLPTIEANKARVMKEAVSEVLKYPAEIISLRVTPTGLEPEDEVVYRVDTEALDRVFFGYAEDGSPLGFALVGAAFGYGSDPIQLMFGYDPETNEIVGLKVLEHKETPGIGTKIEDDESFAGLFWRPPLLGDLPARQPPLLGKRDDQFVPGEPTHVDMISGATISSKAVLKIVNEVVGRLGDRLQTPEVAR